MDYIYKTEKERERAARKAKVISDYRRIKTRTGYADHRIIQMMLRSGNYGYKSFMGIYYTIKQADER